MAATNVAANVSSVAEDSRRSNTVRSVAHAPRIDREVVVDASGQAVASCATFAGCRIRMAFPKGSRTPMSVP